MIPWNQLSNTNDEILKKFHEMEERINDQGKTKLSYGSICKEQIHPLVPIEDFPYKFEVPKMDKLMGKGDPRDYIR